MSAFILIGAFTLEINNISAVEATTLASDKALLMELDGLKSVHRKSVISDGSRYENSAEHSWHLAVAFLALKNYLPLQFDLPHAIEMALTHDICEIGAGDTCAYNSKSSTTQNEHNYLKSLEAEHTEFGKKVRDLWMEYEAQETIESQWVKVIDKLLPFLLNITTNGRTWQEQGITKTMIVEHNQSIEQTAPTIYNWMLNELDKAVANKWVA